MSSTENAGVYGRDTEQIVVSVIIKALNEEAKVADAIESAFKGVEGLAAEIILADSLSTDRTVEIAKKYPVKIAQLKCPDHRCCGVGPQLGYQHSRGEYVYILDGDMLLEPEFIPRAVKLMRQRLDVAGVAGIVRELGGRSYDFERRKLRDARWTKAGEQEWLDMGGLYRRTAVDSVGYLSNLNLHAFEEQELGHRLISAGWKLLRMNEPSVTHCGHTIDTLELIRNRWTSKYIDGHGELLRAALGKPYFWAVAKSQKSVLIMTVFFVGLFIGIALAPWYGWPLAVVLVGLGLVFLIMYATKKDLKMAALGLSLWPIRVAGFVRGVFRPQRNPCDRVPSMLLSGNGKRVAR